MLNELRKKVWEANMKLVDYNLVTFTWGNVSGYDKDSGCVIIKPSGVEYDLLSPENMVILSLNGDIIEGDLKPSSDTATHLELYKKYPQLGGIVHTHSTMAVSWASACMNIPNYNTTHSDYFCADIPCTRSLSEPEVESAYEKNTGLVIIETLEQKLLNPLHNPGIICANHGPFTWGSDPDSAVHNAVVLEEVAKMAYYSRLINPSITKAPDYVINKHYNRKHGKNAYYGQK